MTDTVYLSDDESRLIVRTLKALSDDTVYLSDDESRLIVRTLKALSDDLAREALTARSMTAQSLTAMADALGALAGKLDGRQFFGEMKLPGWVGRTGTPISLDHCWCGRKILDDDDNGTETVSGQRYCIDHELVTEPA